MLKKNSRRFFKRNLIRCQRKPFYHRPADVGWMVNGSWQVFVAKQRHWRQDDLRRLSRWYGGANRVVFKRPCMEELSSKVGVSKISLSLTLNVWGNDPFWQVRLVLFNMEWPKNRTTLTRNRRFFLCAACDDDYDITFLIMMDDGWLWMMMKRMRSMTMLTMMNHEWWSRLGGGVSSCGAERSATHLPTLARCGLLAWVRGHGFWGVIELDPFFLKGGIKLLNCMVMFSGV